jgi:hypothetical protein
MPPAGPKNDKTSAPPIATLAQRRTHGLLRCTAFISSESSLGFGKQTFRFCRPAQRRVTGERSGMA